MTARTARTIEPTRTSAHVAADVQAAENEAAAALAEVERLNGQTRLVLVGGDDAAHERHESEISRHRRIVERANARRDELARELASVEEREAGEAKDRARSEAEAAVAAVAAKAERHYSEPALKIALFLEEWAEAQRLADAARIPGPAFAVRRSIQPSRQRIDNTRRWEAYADEEGKPTLNPHPYKLDGTIDRTKTRPRRSFEDRQPDTFRNEGGLNRADILREVNLPRLTENGHHHRGHDADPNIGRPA